MDGKLHSSPPLRPPSESASASASASASRKRINTDFVAAASDVVRSPYFCPNPRIEAEEDETKVPQKKKAKLVVSPYFNHNYTSGMDINNNGNYKVVVQKKAAQGEDGGNTSGGDASSFNHKGKAKVVIVSPYFQNHNYNNGNYKVVVQKKATERAQGGEDGCNTQNHNYNNGNYKGVVQKKATERAQGDEDGCNTSGYKDKGKAKVGGDASSCKDKGKAKVVIVSPYFQNHNYNNGNYKVVVQKKATDGGNTSAYKDKGKAKVGGDACKDKEKEKVGGEKAKVVIVSPYFENHNYNGNYKVVVQKKATERAHLLVQPHNRRSIIKFNPFLQAYRRKNNGNYWQPPTSNHRLLQEKHWEDPWKVLIICMLLNRTTGRQARQVISHLFNLCPNAKAATNVETEEIEKIICSLGLQKKRSSMIQRFSQEYLSNEWTHVTQLHGIGKYAADAYAIFCTGRWKDVQPDDHKLVPYWQDLWESEMIGNLG